MAPAITDKSYGRKGRWNAAHFFNVALSESSESQENVLSVSITAASPSACSITMANKGWYYYILNSTVITLIVY